MKTIIDNFIDDRSVYITRFKLNKKEDIKDIRSELKAGKILFLQTTQFFKKYQDDLLTLKGMVDHLKKMAMRYGGSIGRVGNNVLVISPNQNVKLF